VTGVSGSSQEKATKLNRTRRRLRETAKIQNRLMMVKVLNMIGIIHNSLAKLHQGVEPSLLYQPFNKPTKKPKVIAKTTGKM